MTALLAILRTIFRLRRCRCSNGSPRSSAQVRRVDAIYIVRNLDKLGHVRF
jgi:hypothetical protein